METLLRESVATAPVKTGNRWRVIVAKPGKGSSGIYSEDVFRRDAAKIIAPGGQSFITHDDKRDPRSMIGTYPEGAYWSEEDKAVVAELEVFSHWKEWVEEVGPHCGISLYAMGEQDDEGNVTSFIEDVYNGADLVSRPGLTGSGMAEKLYEAARAASEQKTDVETSAQERKEMKEMDQEDKAAIAALISSVNALVSAHTAKNEQAAQIEADDKAVEERVAKIAANLDAIEAAREELLPSQVDDLRAEAKLGTDVLSQIEKAKKVKTEAVESAKALTESAGGRVVGAGSDWKPGAYA
jgi:hypothetical protein